MPVPTSVKEFVDCCLKSGVVNEMQLHVFAAENPGTPDLAARSLVRKGLLTKF